MTDTPTYSKTWEQCRDEVARRLAKREGITPNEAVQQLAPGAVNGRWVQEINKALVQRKRLAPDVFRGLAESMGTCSINALKNDFVWYDWSYAQPLIEALEREWPVVAEKPRRV